MINGDWREYAGRFAKSGSFNLIFELAPHVHATWNPAGERSLPRHIIGLVMVT
jgi:hypothetical protein